MTEKVITIIAPLGEPDKRIRLAKVISLLNIKLKVRSSFWGWKRAENDCLGKNLSEVSDSKCLLSGGGHGSNSHKLYFLWVLKVFFAVLWHRPRLVYAVGLETALPVWMACFFSRSTTYVFDDADRFVMLFPMPSIVKKTIVFFEKRVSEKAMAHITPSFSRYDYRNEKMVEVPNTPTNGQVKEATQNAETPSDSYLSLYVCGLLTPTRGLDLILEAAEYLQKNLPGKVYFHVAAFRNTPELAPLLNLDNVTYLGGLSQVDSLVQYTRSHFAITLYDPATEINRYAVPNKWGDAIFMRTPIILNEGLKTSEHLTAEGACVVVPFAKGKLGPKIHEIVDNPVMYKKAYEGIFNISHSLDYFDDVIVSVLREAYSIKS